MHAPALVVLSTRAPAWSGSSDVLNASVDVRFDRVWIVPQLSCRRNFIGLRTYCFACRLGIRSIVQRRTLLLGFYWNPTELELRSSWFRCEHLTKVIWIHIALRYSSKRTVTHRTLSYVNFSMKCAYCVANNSSTRAQLSVNFVRLN